MNDNIGWSSEDLTSIAKAKNEIAQWRASFAKYLVPYDARIKLADGEEKWSTIGDYDIDIVWTRHQDGTITYEVMHTPGWDLDTDEQYCNECHSEMVQDEDGDWHCNSCGNVYPLDDIEMGIVNCPSEEASYDWDTIEADPAWYRGY